MKTNAMIATIFLLATSANTMAQDAYQGASVVTRAEVQAELAQSRADGSYSVLHSEYAYMYPSNFQSSKSRGEVATELQEAVSNGSHAWQNREAAHPAENFISTRSRAEVISDMEKAFADPAFRKAQQDLYRG